MYPYPHQEYESGPALTQRVKDQYLCIRAQDHHGLQPWIQVELYKLSTCNSIHIPAK